MAKYDPLYHFLVKQEGKNVTLTFDEVEKIIGEVLPSSAYKHPEWWANGTMTNPRHVECFAWENAGYKAKADLDRKIVSFKKI